MKSVSGISFSNGVGQSRRGWATLFQADRPPGQTIATTLPGVEIFLPSGDAGRERRRYRTQNLIPAADGLIAVRETA
jgi:hypothetical protein